MGRVILAFLHLLHACVYVDKQVLELLLVASFSKVETSYSLSEHG